MTGNPCWQAIPTKLSEAQFEEFVLPHLSRGRRGPPPTLSLQRVRRRHWLPPPPQRTGQATFTALYVLTHKVRNVALVHMWRSITISVLVASVSANQRHIKISAQ
jgi:hypothetical protein